MFIRMGAEASGVSQKNGVNQDLRKELQECREMLKNITFIVENEWN